MNISSVGSLTNKSIVSSKASLSVISSASITSTAIATKNNSLSKAGSRNQRDYKFLDIKELLDRGAEVNVKDDEGYTPLHHAAAGNSVNSVIMLIDRGANVNSVTNAGWGSLHLAGKNDCSEVVDVLLKKGINPNLKANAGWAALHVMAQRNSFRSVQVMVENGCDVNTKTVGCDTPLHIAASNNSTATAILLLEYGADLHSRDADCFMTPLCTSCIYGFPCNYVCFQLLDLEWKRDGFSPLLDHCKFNPCAILFYPFMFSYHCFRNVCINRDFKDMWRYTCKTTLEAIWWISPFGFMQRATEAEIVDVKIKKFATRESVAWAERSRQQALNRNHRSLS